MQGGDAAVADSAFEELSKAKSGLIALRPPLQHDAATYASLFDGLIVLNDVVLTADKPTSGLRFPQIKRELVRWRIGLTCLLADPTTWSCRRSTRRPNGAMKKQASDPGDEVFLAVCGLMANGARTILLSRWRTGGQTSVDLVREFLARNAELDSCRSLAAQRAGRF